MINTNMPAIESSDAGTKVHGEGAAGVHKLNDLKRIALKNDNSTTERLLHCIFWPSLFCCRRKYTLRNVEPGYKFGDTVLYRVVNTSVCCPNQWTVYNGETDDKVFLYTRKDACCKLRLCFGGPGFDVHDLKDGEKGTNLGDANYPKCQCFDGGYDIRDAEPRRKYFVGYICNCCGDDIYPVPVWNEDKNEMVKYNLLIIPCLKRWFPVMCCCMKNHWVVDFPDKANASEKAGLIAGNLMDEMMVSL
jgi:hypothetical protein